MFDENGDRKGLTQIEQLQGRVEVQIGSYDPYSIEPNKIMWSPDNPIIWKGLCVCVLLEMKIIVILFDSKKLIYNIIILYDSV